MSAPKRDAVLFFAPGAIKATMPELGLPDLAAWLKAEGMTAVIRDYNLLFWRSFMDKPGLKSRLKEALAGEEARLFLGMSKKAHDALVKEMNYPGFRFSPGSMLDMRGAEIDVGYDHMEAAQRLFGITPSDYRLQAVASALSAPNALLDEFFDTVKDDFEDEPLIAGASVALSEQFFSALYILKKIKALYPSVKTIIGGPMISMARSLLPRWLPSFDFIDAACVFEGQLPLAEAVRRLRKKESLKGVPGLAINESGKIYFTQPLPPPSLDELPYSDFSGLPIDLYADKALPVQSSRNCSWGKCAFCYHRVNSAREGHEERSAAKVVEHIKKQLSIYNDAQIFIADSCPRKELVIEIAKEILRAEIDVKWHVMARFCGEYDGEASLTLALSGLTNIYMGLESSSPAQLARINKNISLSAAESDLKNLSEAGIKVSLFLIDMPGQSEEELIATFQWCLRRSPHINNLIAQKFELGLTTEAFANPKILGVVPKPGWDEWLNVFGVPYSAQNELSRGRFEAIDELFIKEFYKLKAGLTTVAEQERAGLYDKTPPQLKV